MTVATNISQYEIERNKPLPNRIHGQIESDLSFALNLNYREKYQFALEVSLATTPSSTPDVTIFPKKKLSLKTIKAKEEEAPITTIEIQSPSQSIEELQKKAWNLYFPMGVQSAWIVIPSLKAVKILLPDDSEFFYNSDKLKDPVTNIEIEIKEIFANMV